MDHMCGIREIKVTTDGSIDTSSIGSIVQGLSGRGSTDEERVLEFYHWFRRMFYHHRNMGRDRRDFLKAINSYGCNLCGSQAALFAMLMRRAGYPVRIVAASGGPVYGTHTFVEVHYQDGWHCFDTMTSFYVLTRDSPPHIASLDELRSDSSLVAKAVEEARAAKEYLLCHRHQELDAEALPALRRSAGLKEIRWSYLLFKGGTIHDFWVRASSKGRTLAETGAHGGSYTPEIGDFVLRPNEEYVRLWDNVGKWVKGSAFRDYGPHHTCGSADEHDPVNFRYFEPYLKTDFGHTKRCYRYYGNGWLEWKPDVNAGDIDRACTTRSLSLGKDGFYEVDGHRRGVLLIGGRVPYAAMEIEIDLAYSLEGSGCSLRVFLLKNKGRTVVRAWEKNGNAQGIETIVISHPTSGLFEYQLRIEGMTAPGGTVRFVPRRLKTYFQENIYSLPGFRAGANTVRVAARDTAALSGHRLILRYDWREGPRWDTPRTLTREITTMPSEFEVQVEGDTVPRMERLAIMLAPSLPLQSL